MIVDDLVVLFLYIHYIKINSQRTSLALSLRKQTTTKTAPKMQNPS